MSPKQSTLRELQKAFTNRVVIFSYLTLTALCIITGPFGTYEQISLILRIPYWAGVIAFCFAAAIIIQHFVSVRREHSVGKKILALIAQASMIALVIALFLFALNSIIWGDLATLPNFFSYLMLTLPISAVLSLMINIFTHQQKPDVPRHEVALLRRLPTHHGTNILYLSVKDHYVEVVTDKGSHLILMRFGDALAELEGLDGVQIHRSFWVAKTAVKNVQRNNGKLTLIMSDGAKLPVSRSHMANVRQSLKV